MPDFNRNDAPPPADDKPAPRRASMNRTLFLALLAGLAGYLISSRLYASWRDNEEARRDFEVMRTYARIIVPKGSGSSMTPASLADLAEQAVREVNDLMGPFGDRSDVRRLNESKAGTWVEVNPRTWLVVMEALRWHRLSGGAFDPTVGPVMRLFTFDQSEHATWPDADAFAKARERIGADKIRFEREGMRLAWEKDGMLLDLGAIAKGYGADRAAEVLIANGVKNALVDIGGELRIIGMKPGDPPAPWKAGVRNPRGEDVLMKLDLTNAAVATSGDYEKYFIYQGKRYEHIIDPRTGLPLTERVASVTVIHPKSCLAADALATTMCVLGPDAGEAFLREQALGLFSAGVRVIMVLVEKDGSLREIDFQVDDKGEVKVSESKPKKSDT